MFVPDGQGGVTLYDGNDGGVGFQHVTSGQALTNAGWGRGLNGGFNTLRPYSAPMAKDGTAYAGLQDNGELRTEPSGSQFMTHDGDGTWSAVDPDDSNIVYERQPGGGIQGSTDGGRTWNAPGGRELANALSVLLTMKTRAGYGEATVTADQEKRAERAAKRLLDAARQRRAG